MGKIVKPQPATKSDLKSLEKTLHSEIKNVETSLRLEITSLEIKTDLKLEKMEERIDGNARKYRDQILSSNDGLMKQLETMRTENTFGAGQAERIDDQIENHEKRIQKLEQLQQTA